MTRTPWTCQPGAARVARVLPGSIAEALGIEPGDVIRSVNGHAVTDYIAYRFATADEEIALEVERGDERAVFEIEKEADDELGIVFTGDVFDGVRSCCNKCIFCFEQQMPAGMRPSLQLRDDDFRLSFIHGNFLTLTNMDEGDYARIFREHLSPLFISIHATDTDIRRRMLRNRRAPDIMTAMRRLIDGGIELHGQIVLCPGWNDGDVLARTLDDLAGLHPGLLSVGIVPVGLTGHRPAGREMRAVTPDDAAAALELIGARQTAFHARLGARLVHAADEFYLATGRSLPPAGAYEGFPQKENGIGLARLLLDDIDRLTFRRGESVKYARATLVTGTLAAPLLELLAARLRRTWQIDLRVAAVPNRHYGGGVSVAGLLTGNDLLAALAGSDPGELLLLPQVMLNGDGIFLDDLSPSDIEARLGIPLHFCASPADVVSALTGRHSPGGRREA